jgi:hypothetical protein
MQSSTNKNTKLSIQDAMQDKQYLLDDPNPIEVGEFAKIAIKTIEDQNKKDSAKDKDNVAPIIAPTSTTSIPSKPSKPSKPSTNIAETVSAVNKVNDVNANVETVPKEKKPVKTTDVAENVFKEIRTAQSTDKDAICNTEWAPKVFTLLVTLGTFMLSFMVVVVAMKMRQRIQNKVEYLYLLPVIVSYSGSIGVNNMTRTLLVWNDDCFANPWSKVKWLAQQIIRSIIIGCMVGATAFIIITRILKLSHHLGVSVSITLVVVLVLSSFIGVLAPLVLRLVSLNASQFSGNMILLINDLMATLVYFTISGFVIKNHKSFGKFVKQNMKPSKWF